MKSQYRMLTVEESLRKDDEYVEQDGVANQYHLHVAPPSDTATSFSSERCIMHMNRAWIFHQGQSFHRAQPDPEALCEDAARVQLEGAQALSRHRRGLQAKQTGDLSLLLPTYRAPYEYTCIRPHRRTLQCKSWKHCMHWRIRVKCT